jgi:hypothetical protein
MLYKEKVKELIDQMPDTFSADDLIEKIVLLQKIEGAQKEIENGDGIDWEDIKKEMDSWLVSI